MQIDQLIIYKNISQDVDVLKCLSFVEDESLINESEFISQLLILAEKYELHGQLFQSLLTYLLAYHENTFTLALERKKEIPDSLKKVVCHDFEYLFIFVVLKYPKFIVFFHTALLIYQNDSTL